MSAKPDQWEKGFFLLQEEEEEAEEKDVMHLTAANICPIFLLFHHIFYVIVIFGVSCWFNEK